METDSFIQQAYSESLLYDVLFLRPGIVEEVIFLFEFKELTLSWSRQNINKKTRGDPMKTNYVLEGRGLVVQASPARWCSRNPSVSVYQLMVLWEAAFAFIEFFWRLFQCIWLFVMYDSWACLPTPHWVFSSFWSKTAWLLCPTVPIHWPQATVFFFPRWKNSSEGKHFAHGKEVKQKKAEALKSIKIIKFRNCSEQWKKHLIRCIALNGEYFEDDWSWNM